MSCVTSPTVTSWSAGRLRLESSCRYLSIVLLREQSRVNTSTTRTSGVRTTAQTTWLGLVPKSTLPITVKSTAHGMLKSCELFTSRAYRRSHLPSILAVTPRTFTAPSFATALPRGNWGRLLSRPEKRCLRAARDVMPIPHTSGSIPMASRPLGRNELLRSGRQLADASLKQKQQSTQSSPDIRGLSKQERVAQRIYLWGQMEP